MADNKNTLMSSIAKNVEQIKVSKFGTKLPSNKNKETESTIQELAYEQMIMGTLASLVWGKTNIKKEDQVKTLLGNTKNIYKLIEDSVKYSEKLYGQLNSTINDKKSIHVIINQSSINKILEGFAIIKDAIDAQSDNKNINQLISKFDENLKNQKNNEQQFSIDINITKLSDLTEFVKSLEGIDGKTGAIVGLKSIIEFLELLNRSELKDLSNKVRENLSTVKSIISDNSGELNEILNAIKRASDGLTDIKDLSNLSDILSTFIKIITIDPKSIDVKGIKILKKLTDEKTGDIIKLIENLNKITVTLDKNKEQTFNTIETFFNSLTAIGEIGFVKRRKIKSNINYINKNIIDMIPELAQKLQDVASKNEKNALTAINNLSALFKSIVDIAELDIKDKIRLKLNLIWIKNTYIETISSILQELQNTIKDQGSSTSKALEGLSKLFEDLIKIGDLSFMKILKISIKMDMIQDVIENSIFSVLSSINNTRINIGNASQRIDSINDILEKISVIYEGTPSVKSSIIESIKLSLLYSNVENIKDLVKLINLVSVIKNPELFNEMIPNTINDISLIFGESPKNTYQQLLYVDDDITLFKDNIIAKLNATIAIINSIPAIRRTAWLKTLKTILDEFNNTEPDTIGSKIEYLPGKESLQDFLKVGVSLKSFINIVSSMNELDEKQIENINNILEITKTIVEKFDTTVSESIAANLDNIDDKHLDKIDTMIKLLEKLSKLGKIKFILNISKKTMDNMAYLADPLKKFIEKLAEVKDDDVKKAKDIINTYFKVVIMGAAILLGAGLIMKNVNIVALTAFTVLLSGFLFAVSLTLKIIGKALKDDLKTVKEATILIAACGAIMLFASILSELIKPENLLVFTGMLALLLFSVGFVFRLFHKGFENVLEGARDAIIIIGGAAAILLFGGIITRLIRPEDLLLFTGTLAVFLFSVSLVFLIFKAVGSEIMHAAKDAAILIAVSGGILILGGLFMKIIKPKELIQFTICLGVFLLSISLIFILFKKSLDKALQGVKGAMIIIAGSALIMIVGALFMKDPKLALSALLFTVCLGVFIFSILWVYKQAAKDIKTSFSTAIAFGILTFISAAIMLGGAAILMNYPELILYAIVFGALFWAFTKVMINALSNLVKEQKNIWGSIGVLIALGIVTVLMAYALKKTVEAANMVQDWWTLVGTVAVMGLVIYGLYALVKAIGNSGPEAMLYMVAGEAILAGLVGIIYLIGKAVSAIAQGIDDLARVSHADIDLGNLVKLLLGFGMLVAPMLQLGGMLPIIGLGALSMLAMRSFLYDAADIIQAYASLKIPMYDENGKLTGYKIMSEEDISKSIENTKSIVTALFTAVQEIYDANPKMFEFSLSSLLTGGGGTVFGKVAAAGKGLAAMLSELAVAVQDWADLKIPIYEGTKITGYKTIDNDAFIDAAKHIKEVVKCLGQAVLDIYKEAPDGMFEPAAWGLFGPSPYSKVVTALKTMGPMLSSIAKGVKEWADFKIPIYEGTKIVGYDTIKDSTMETAAGHIKSVIKTLGKAIIETYDECEKNEKTKGMFDPQGFLGLGKSKFARVTQAFKTMGPMLSSIADAISKWAELKIPVYKGTEIVEYKTIKDAEFDQAAEHIKKVLTCIGTALVEVVEKNPKIFGEDIFTDGPAIVAAKAMNLMGETLNLTATAVASYASGKFPLFDKDGKYIKDIEVKETDYTKASQNIQKVLTCIGNALKDVVDNSEIFDDGLFSDAPAIKAAEAIKGMSEALNNSVTAIAKLAELDLNELHTALDPNGPDDNIYHKLNDLLTFTVDIYRLFVAEDSKTSIHNTTVRHWYGDDHGVTLSFADYLDEHNGDVEDANEALETFTKTLSSMLNNYAEIGKIVNNNKDALAIFEGGNNSSIYKYLNDSMSSVASIIRLLIAEDKLDLFDDIEDEEDDIIDGIKSTTNICKTMLNGVLDIKKLFNEISEFNMYKMIPMIYSFDMCVKTLSKIGKEESSVSSIKLSLPSIDASILSKQIEMYSDALDMIIKINEHAQAAGEEGYNVLRDGILKIYGATSQIEDNGIFSQHVKKLQDYVTAINSIRLNNLIKLRGLIDSMNELSRRLGNIDKLTDAVGNKLSQVLYELVLQLRKAEETIHNAHELQEKRKKLMEESMTKIERIMGQHMIVEVSQVQTEQQTTTTSGGANNSTNTNNTNNETTHEDNTPPTSTPKLNNPENATAANGTTKRVDKTQLSKDVLTESEFKRWMQDEFITLFRSQ